MRRINTVVMGGGQAGLAMSRCLSDRGIEHVVLERGRVGERWRSERWDSLRLLTPRWQSRLPGWSYQGPDPDGFMSKDEVVGYLENYARFCSAPVETGVNVLSVQRRAYEFRVTTSRGEWAAQNVVVATGACASPKVPSLAGDLSADVNQVVPAEYKRPEQLPEGGVLVVGAAATGVQLAAELRASGRRVILAVGRHIRLPRRYRGRDIMSWLDTLGILDETIDTIHDVAAARRTPSLQLVGRPDHRDLDLTVLQKAGVELVGRLTTARGQRVEFADDLPRTVAAADAKLARILTRIDRAIDDRGLTGVEPERLAPVRVNATCSTLDLKEAGITSVLWATGFRRTYPWLRVPGVLDAHGELIHSGGVTPEPGLYAIGLNVMRRRKSTFLDGVGTDANELAEHMFLRLARRRVA